MSSGYVRIEQAHERLIGSHVEIGEALRVLVGPSGRLSDAILFKDDANLIGLLVELPEGRERFDLPLGRTLLTAWVTTRGADGEATRLKVLCTDKRLRRTFLSLIGEMLDRADDSGRPCIDELNEVLGSWRAALARARGELDEQRAIGLFGELSVLEQLARRDPMVALASWKGPEQNRHDFAIRNALEVKTFTGTGAPAVTIHGLRQLDPPMSGRLHLVAFRVTESASGSTLTQLVDRIASSGVPRDALERSLGDDASAIQTTARSFQIEETRLHEVTAEFPGIRASRIEGSMLSGVDDVHYTLRLDACPGRLDPASLTAILEEL